MGILLENYKPKDGSKNRQAKRSTELIILKKFRDEGIRRGREKEKIKYAQEKEAPTPPSASKLPPPYDTPQVNTRAEIDSPPWDKGVLSSDNTKKNA